MTGGVKVSVSRAVYMCMLLILGASNANAGTTCEAFAESLWHAIEKDGTRVALPNLEGLAYRRTDGSLSRYEMKGIVGLTGDLRCKGGLDDDIEAFEFETPA